MTPGWDFNLRDDIGGLGAGKLFSWYLVTFVGHRFSLFGARAEAGFEALYQDYRTGSGTRRYGGIIFCGAGDRNGSDILNGVRR
jgi:hypothetical protein